MQKIKDCSKNNIIYLHNIDKDLQTKHLKVAQKILKSI